MFEGEHASLNAIHAAVPSLAPQAFAWGKLDNGKANPGSYFLATEFLELGGRSSSSSSSVTKTRSHAKGKDGSGLSLAQKLARLHSTPAPVPQGYDGVPQFGFPVTTCCGDTPQENGFRASWAEFFAEQRLLMILQRGEANNGKDPELRKVVERAARDVVPRLLGDGHLGGEKGISPVVVHGDLWAGNHGKGRFVGRARREDEDEDQGGEESGDVVEEVVFDPSACYAHNEYEFGIMRMFGGFGGKFWSEYHDMVPKTEPVDEYEDRLSLYESYHHLNHWAIFGGGYRSGAMGILKRLIAKYGGSS